eukprot:Gregarina_sp_Poly_1__7554@NODE_422_length_8655_cov_206_021076_g344_i0_p10_GENE_NODE_422_length_8655_cov_206_021076_g344_i0NODE_422_length_8655_cov_206_021076_g344_i0_p10_ORF_typecomplete_len113_score8_85TatD_DNase/PF01026_21/0_06_NODE_422_length_8655_cov_206_021076_g344_i017412079
MWRFIHQAALCESCLRILHCRKTYPMDQLVPSVSRLTLNTLAIHLHWLSTGNSRYLQTIFRGTHVSVSPANMKVNIRVTKVAEGPSVSLLGTDSTATPQSRSKSPCHRQQIA